MTDVQKPMTDAQKTKIFDLLVQKKVILIRKGGGFIDGKITRATWIEHGENKDALVEGFVS